MRIIAPMMILIMMTSTLAGCTGGDPDSGGEMDSDAINDLIDQNLQDFINNTTLPQGPPGSQGPAGADGQNGTDGQDGADGTDGANGVFTPTICELIPWGYCVGADLNGMDMSGLDLTGINFRGASIRVANLSGATLDYAEMRNVDLTDSNLEQASMNYANLQYAELQGANLVNASLVRADISWATMWTTNMTGANFNWANLEYSGMSQVVAVGASFAHANLQQTQIFGDFREIYTWQTDFRYSWLGGDFQNSTLNGFFSDGWCGYWVGYCNFSNAVLHDDFRRFTFHNTDLTGAYFSGGADLSFANLQTANITNEDGGLATVLQWTVWHNTVWIDGSTCNENPVYWGNSPSLRTCDSDGIPIDV